MCSNGCNRCDGEGLICHRESRGECWGFPAYEDVAECPYDDDITQCEYWTHEGDFCNNCLHYVNQQCNLCNEEEVTEVLTFEECDFKVWKNQDGELDGDVESLDDTYEIRMMRQKKIEEELKRKEVEAREKYKNRYVDGRIVVTKNDGEIVTLNEIIDVTLDPMICYMNAPCLTLHDKTVGYGHPVIWFDGFEDGFCIRDRDEYEEPARKIEIVFEIPKEFSFYTVEGLEKTHYNRFSGDKIEEKVKKIIIEGNKIQMWCSGRCVFDGYVKETSKYDIDIYGVIPNARYNRISGIVWKEPKFNKYDWM